MEDLLLRGDLGPVRLNMTPEQVLSLLGESDIGTDLSRKKGNRGRGIWKYGDVELHFENGTLFLIYSDGFKDAPLGGSRLTLDPWWIRRNITLPQAKQKLDALGSRYIEKSDRYNPDSVVLDLNAFASLHFGPDGMECFSVMEHAPLNID
jgi:hypothetical protein